MSHRLFVFTLFFLIIAGCTIEEKLPYNAVVLEQVIYVDEVQNGTPQTVQMPNGKAVTYKMPEKLTDGQLIKIRDIKGEPPYYIRVKLREREKSGAK